MTRRRGSARVADALRDSPPPLDELRRARMERRLLDAVSSGEHASGEPARALSSTSTAGRAGARERTGRLRAGAIGALAMAASIALGLVAWPRLSSFSPLSSLWPEDAPVARFALIGESTASGTIDVGATLEVDDGDRAEVRAFGVEVDLEGGTAMRFGALAEEHVRLELTRGAIEVAFHPRVRGRERLTIETPSARVEVVGTVFTVRLEGEGGATTRVSVREGVVRVVPRGMHGGDDTESAVRVRAGQSVAIGGASDPARTAAAGREVHGEAAVAIAEIDVAGEVEAELGARRPARSPARARADDEVMHEEAAAAAPDDGAGALLDEPPSASVPFAPEAAVTPRQQAELASRLLERGDHAGARAVFAQIARSPRASRAQRAEAQSAIGDSFFATGDLREAEGAYEAAARIGAGTAEGANAIYSLARHQERELRQPEQARRTYLRYLDEAPNGALARQAEAAICRLGGDPRVDCGGRTR